MKAYLFQHSFELLFSYWFILFLWGRILDFACQVVFLAIIQKVKLFFNNQYPAIFWLLKVKIIKIISDMFWNINSFSILLEFHNYMLAIVHCSVQFNRDLEDHSLQLTMQNSHVDCCFACNPLNQEESARCIQG